MRQTSSACMFQFSAVTVLEISSLPQIRGSSTSYLDPPYAAGLQQYKGKHQVKTPIATKERTCQCKTIEHLGET